MPLALPAEAVPLAAVAAAPDGRLAAVAADGRAWIRAPVRGSDATGDVAGPAWTPLHAAVDPAGLPGPVLGAAWTRSGDALLLLSGSPGSGVRRMALVTLPVAGGGSARVAIVALEADGPGIAPLDDGQVAFVARDRLDRGALARLTPAGTVATLPVAGRSVAAGGDTVVLVDDTAARFGTLADLRHGVLPTVPLPIAADGGLGAVAVAIDGQAVALVRLDGEGAPAAVDVVRWAGTGWEAGGSIPLDAAAGSALLAWLP